MWVSCFSLVCSGKGIKARKEGCEGKLGVVGEGSVGGCHLCSPHDREDGQGMWNWTLEVEGYEGAVANAGEGAAGGCACQTVSCAPRG